MYIFWDIGSGLPSIRYSVYSHHGDYANANLEQIQEVANG